IYWVRMIRDSKTSLAEYFKESGLKYSYDHSLISVSKKSRTVKSKKKYGETMITAVKGDGTEYPVAVRVFVLKQQLQDMVAFNTSMTINAPEYLTVSGFLPDRWESTKPSVASIDPKTGLITIRSRGTCKIKAYYRNTAVVGKLSCEVPKFSRKFYRMRTGQNKKIKIKKVKKYDIVSWNVISGDSAGTGSSAKSFGTTSQNRSSTSYNSSSQVGTAEIDDNGQLTALTAGDVTVQATVYGQTITCKVHIEPPLLRKKSLTMDINKTKRLKLSRTKLKYVEWKSTNDQIAYVDPVSGKVYGLKSGRVTLKTDAGGVVNSCTVLVQDPGQVTKGPGLSK
nr:hypothetical protein [Lachnospiraceae bacterium]